jgi:hypothetical protein
VNAVARLVTISTGGSVRHTSSEVCAATGMLACMAANYAPESRPGGPTWARQCLAGRHTECGHFSGIGYGPRKGARLWLGVCQCSCHSTCLLTGRGPFVWRAIWDGLCDCPGADLAAEKLDVALQEATDFGDFARRWDEQRGDG